MKKEKLKKAELTKKKELMKKSKMMKKALYTYCSKQPPLMKKGRGRHLKRCSVIAILLRYHFALSQNAFVFTKLWKRNFSFSAIIIGEDCTIAKRYSVTAITLR